MDEFRKMDDRSVKERRRLVTWFMGQCMRVLEDGEMSIKASPGKPVELSWADMLVNRVFTGRDVEEACMKFILYSEYEGADSWPGGPPEFVDEALRCKAMEKLFMKNYSVSYGFIEAFVKEYV